MHEHVDQFFVHFRASKYEGHLIAGAHLSGTVGVDTGDTEQISAWCYLEAFYLKGRITGTVESDIVTVFPDAVFGECFQYPLHFLDIGSEIADLQVLKAFLLLHVL